MLGDSLLLEISCLLLRNSLKIMSDSSSNTGPYVPEPTSPLFLVPSNVPSVSLVIVPFFGTGFGGWKRNMIVSLPAKKQNRFYRWLVH